MSEWLFTFLQKNSTKNGSVKPRIKKVNFCVKNDIDRFLENDYNVGKLRGKIGVIL